jgi:asparagine synthase (glutamine-hydrolysing)
MCGIAGVVAADPRLVEPAVRSMMRAMVHRGPDDEGYEEFPIATGHQPMVHPDTGDCLIFNGEIYNFRWLRAKLEGLGVSVRSSGDRI